MAQVPDYKIQKKGQYLFHPELAEHVRFGARGLLKNHMWLWLVAILAILIGTKASLIISYCVTMSILLLFFWYIVKPLMLKGKIKAYYRKEYAQSTLLYFSKLIIQWALPFGMTIIVWFLGSLYWFKDEPVTLRETQHQIIGYISNGYGIGLAILVFSIMFYYLFYHEKFATIEYFSNRITELARFRGKGLYFAYREFIHEQEKVLENQMLQDIKYEVEPKTEMVNNNRPNQSNNSPSTKECIPNNTNMTTAPVSEEDDSLLMRRKSRR